MIILLILALSIIIFQIVMTFNIKIEIENLKVSLPEINRRYINKESKISMKFYLLKIKIKEIDLKKIKIDTEKSKNRINKLKQKFKGKRNGLSLIIRVIDILRKNSYKFEKLDLSLFISTEDAAITAILTGFISLFIGNMLKNKITDINVQRFRVIPIYANKNNLKINLSGIFSINITNIIDILKILIRGRGDKNGRTSYRRNYAYSNE